jgi:predicted CxxxxCH...CXXCH cytochrome family protein
MSKNPLALLAVVAGIAALAGCDQARPLEGTQGGQGGACGTCHGDPPPPGAGLPGSNPSAHPANVTNCYACHSTTVDASGNVVPATSGGTHQNGTIDVTNPHATTPNWADPSVHAPAAVADIASCQACHGTDFNGGGYAPMSCNACHQSAGWNASALTTNCTFCHGTPAKPSYTGANDGPAVAPPQMPPGATGTAGAHQPHLTGTTLRSSPIACADCHGAAPSSLAHVNGAVAFAWSDLARGVGAAGGPVTPSFANGNCTNYCHGATLHDGAQTTVAWTATSVACGSCHGFPPISVSPHTSSTTNCTGCHPAVPGPQHMNGVVNVSGVNCTSCHGGVDNQTGAPPQDLAGTNTGPGVGAHTAHDPANNCQYCHAVPASTSTPGHTTPNDGRAEVTFSGRATLNGAPAAYDSATRTCSGVYCHGGTLSGGSQTSIAWGGAVSGCGACHGNPPTAVAPHGAAGVPATCTSCHPAATATTHVNGTVDLTAHAAGYANASVHGPDAIANIASCQTCHGTDFNGNGYAPMSCNACHANAQNDWNTSALTTNCTFCHGTKTKTGYPSIVNPVLAAPPEAVNGNPSNPAIGAHQAHLAGPYTYSDGSTCNDCHAVPAQGNLAHIAGAAGVDFTWSDLAKGVGAVGGPVTPTWNATNLTCTNYCHGATLVGGTATSPTWTATSLACNACHGLAPNTGQHARHVSYYSGRGQATCYLCHASVATNTTTPAISATGQALHVDGHNSVVFGGRPTATYDPAGLGTCTNICHGSDVWR